MFAKTIIDSDAFLDMPLSTQSLYFHLTMRADDDGFINNPKKIQRMIGASDDDLKMLVVKRFIIPFDSGIVVIKHWKIHNYIRGDRKKETVYPKEMSLLSEKENGAYTLKSEDPFEIEQPKQETASQKAYRESSLPYSFEYKISQAFYGEICPVCGFAMQGSVDECGVSSYNRKPSIQHNLPISKGGKHELGNISVICHQCNVTLQDTETGKLNADEVIKKWDEICMSSKCQSSDGQVTVKCQHRLGKDSIVEDSIGKKKQHENSVLTSEFEEVWKLYPNKQGKEKSRNCYIKARKEGTAREEIESGVKKYAEYCKAKGIDKKYIKHGDTWFGNKSWQDDYDITKGATIEVNGKTRYGDFDVNEAFVKALERTYK